MNNMMNEQQKSFENALRRYSDDEIMRAIEKAERDGSQRRSQEKIEGSEYKLKSTDHFYYGLYFL